MARWQPPAGAKKVEPPSMAEFHRWTGVGDSVLGVVHRFGSNDYGDFVELRPAIVIPIRGKAQAVAEIAVGLSSNLKHKLSQALLMRPVGITFADKEPRPKGAMNVFDVHELEREYFADALRKMGAAALVPSVNGASNAADDGEETDDLPF